MGGAVGKNVAVVGMVVAHAAGRGAEGAPSAVGIEIESGAQAVTRSVKTTIIFFIFFPCST